MPPRPRNYDKKRNERIRSRLVQFRQESGLSVAKLALRIGAPTINVARYEEIDRDGFPRSID